MSQAHHKTVALRQKAAGAPSEAQLSAIRVHTLRDFAPEELVVHEYALAHNCIDRDRECFDEPLLGDFARTLPGKGVFIKHPSGWDGDSGPGEGKVFEARVEQMSLETARGMLREPALKLPPDRSSVSVLMASAYYVKTPDNTAFLLKHDAGIASDVSIGFGAADRNRIKGSDGIELDAWRWVGPGEALEMSHVWLGAQPGARAVKSATRNEDNDMELKDQLTAATAQVTQLTAEKAAAESANAKYTAVKTALGADAELLDDPARLVAIVSAGKAHRTNLIDTLVTADRLAGRLGDDEAAVKAARDEYAAVPTPTLERLAKHVAPAGTGAPAAASSAIRSADPNAGQPPAPAAVKGVLANPLIGGPAVATA